MRDESKLTPGQQVWNVDDAGGMQQPRLVRANYVRQNWSWVYYRDVTSGQEWCEQGQWATSPVAAWKRYVALCPVLVWLLASKAMRGEIGSDDFACQLEYYTAMTKYATQAMSEANGVQGGGGG